ncbi:MAG: hypothetical protein GY830_01725 [Bacteroidetes bacterium]|nr:hypothetical protein [Bacteroidota bacterium]
MRTKFNNIVFIISLMIAFSCGDRPNDSQDSKNTDITNSSQNNNDESSNDEKQSVKKPNSKNDNDKETNDNNNNDLNNPQNKNNEEPNSENDNVIDNNQKQNNEINKNSSGNIIDDVNLKSLMDNSNDYFKLQNYEIIQSGNSVILHLKSKFEIDRHNGYSYLNQVDKSTINENTQPVIIKAKYSHGKDNYKNIEVLYHTQNGIQKGNAKDIIISSTFKNGFKNWIWNSNRHNPPIHEKQGLKPNCCGKTSHNPGVFFHELKTIIKEDVKIYLISQGYERVLKFIYDDFKAGIKDKNIIIITAGTDCILNLSKKAFEKNVKYAALIHSTC